VARVMSCKRTAMNFCIVFATLAAKFILVVGRRSLVKSAVGIYGRSEISGERTGFLFPPLIARVSIQ